MFDGRTSTVEETGREDGSGDGLEKPRNPIVEVIVGAIVQTKGGEDRRGDSAEGAGLGPRERRVLVDHAPEDEKQQHVGGDEPPTGHGSLR